MKRLTSLLCIFLLGTALTFGETPDEFLDSYEDLVERALDLDSSDPDMEELAEIKAEYTKLTKRVNKVKSKMTNEQIQLYYKLKAKYQKKMTTLKAKRSYDRAKGWIKGLLGD